MCYMYHSLACTHLYCVYGYLSFKCSFPSCILCGACLLFPLCTDFNTMWHVLWYVKRISQFFLLNFSSQYVLQVFLFLTVTWISAYTVMCMHGHFWNKDINRNSTNWINTASDAVTMGARSQVQSPRDRICIENIIEGGETWFQVAYR